MNRLRALEFYCGYQPAFHGFLLKLLIFATDTRIADNNIEAAFKILIQTESSKR